MLALAILFTNIAPFAALNNETCTAVTKKASPTPAEASPGTEKNKRVSIIKDVKNAAIDVKDLVKKHPSIQHALAFIIGNTAIGKLVDAVKEHASNQQFLRVIKTAADKLTEEEVEEKLRDEINTYINRDRDVFEIEDSLIKKSHPKSLFLTLKKLNELFRTYGGFTEALIKYKRSQGEKFTLLPISIKYYPSLCLCSNLLAFTEIDLSGIAFGNLGDYEGTLYEYYDLHRSSWFAACDDDKLIEYIVAHEFGHVMEFLYITLQEKIDWKLYKKVRGRYTLGLMMDVIFNNEFRKTLNLVKDSAHDIGCGIRERAKASALKPLQHNMLSTYALSDDFGKEFFAETFAHLNCSGYVNPLAISLFEVIQGWFPLAQQDSTTSVATT